MTNRSPIKVLVVEAKSARAKLGHEESPLQSIADFEIVYAERLPLAVRLLAECRESGSPCDIVLLDLTTSAAALNADEDGLDAFRLAKALFPEIPLVTLVKNITSENVAAMLAEGAQGCLEKEELNISVLAETLRQAIWRYRSENKRFRAMLDAAPMGIVLAVGRQMVMANPIALEIFGKSENELAAQSIVQIFPAEIRSNLEKALDQGLVDQFFEGDFLNDEGKINRQRIFLKAVLLNNAPALAIYLVSAANADSLSIKTDFENKRFELIQIKQKKMLSLGRLASGISHDFNNLLTAINGYSEHLLTVTTDQPIIRKGLKSILNAGEAAADLTRRLAAFGHSNSTEKGALSIDEAIRALSSQIEYQLGPRIELSLSLTRPGQRANIPFEQFEKLLENVCANSKAAMPAGGKVIISTALSDLDTPMAFPNSFWQLQPKDPSGSFLVVNIQDTGIGMDSEILENLFEPFFSTKKGGRGSGLGLAEVYGILENRGGGIAVATQVGQGSHFRFLLPLNLVAEETLKWPQPQAAQSVEETQFLAKPAWTETILIVDDESSMRDMLTTVLTRFGYQVLAAASIPEALDIVADHAEEIDVVITDMMLRGARGTELAESLQNHKPGQRIIFISGHGLDTLADQGIHVPADAFLEKPFSPTQLDQKIKSILDAVKKSS